MPDLLQSLGIRRGPTPEASADEPTTPPTEPETRPPAALGLAELDVLARFVAPEQRDVQARILTGLDADLRADAVEQLRAQGPHHWLRADAETAAAEAMGSMELSPGQLQGGALMEAFTGLEVLRRSRGESWATVDVGGEATHPLDVVYHALGSAVAVETLQKILADHDAETPTPTPSKAKPGARVLSDERRRELRAAHAESYALSGVPSS